jgi:hyperpolarization activated cyclic nucleotide-gated potassium channel 1
MKKTARNARKDSLSGDSPGPMRDVYTRKRKNSLVSTVPLPSLSLFQEPAAPEPPTPAPEDLSSTAREKWIIRNTPVVQAKYLPVWKRLKAKIRAKLTVKHLQTELQLFGASTIPIESEDLRMQVHKIVRGEVNRGHTWTGQEQKIVVSCGIIGPNHWFKGVWNGALSILLVYTATVMPFRMAFVEEEDQGGWQVWEYIINALFFCDVLVNCCSAYYDNEGKVVTHRGRIIWNYAKSWMAIDIVACVPFSLFDNSIPSSSQSSNVGYSSLLRLLRVPRLYRLFRISRLLKTLKQSSEAGCLTRIQDFVSLKHSAMRLFSFFLTVLICVHLMSCFWYFTATLEMGPECWVYKLGFQDEEISTLYVVSFYWAFTTLTTVGYGDVHATTSLERIISVLWMMFGVCFFSFTIGSLTSMITNVDTRETILTNKLAIIEEFSREAKLDRSLRARLRHSIKYLTEKTGFSWSDKQNIFNELPKDLKYEIAMAMYQGAIKTLPFFQEKNEVFIATIVPFLLPSLAVGGSMIYQEAEYADEVYFIATGRCAVVVRVEGQYTPVKKLQRGAYFGEIEVILGISRKYSVQALVDSDLLVMNKSLLQVIQEEFASVYRELVEIAEARDLINQRAIEETKGLAKMKKQGNLVGIELAKVKDILKKKAEKLNPDKRSSSRRTTIEDMSRSEPSPKAEHDLAAKNATTKDKLEEAERKVKIIKEMLMEQLWQLRGTQGRRYRPVLTPLVLPEPHSAKSDEQYVRADTPSFHHKPPHSPISFD